MYKYIIMNDDKSLYYAWKSDKYGNPILNSERNFKSKSRSNVLKLLAYEENVKINSNDILVKCLDGTTWYVRFYKKL